MPCTTILVGKNASYDGSTLVARNEDSSNGVFEPKRIRVVHPDEQPRVYTSVLSHLTVELPNNPMRYTSVPDVVPGHGIWAEAGFNELNVGMSATETLTTNERVRGADPLVDYVPAKGNEGEDGYVPAQPGGLGEEDMVTLVLPYAKSARDGVRVLGDLLERSIALGFADSDSERILAGSRGEIPAEARLARLWVDGPAPGDVMCPLGMSGRSKKVSDLLGEARIPVSERAGVPMVRTAPGGAVVWVAGVRADERFKCTAATRVAYLLRVVDAE